MTELLGEKRAQKKLAAKMSEQLGPTPEEEERESRVCSVYTNLALESPNITIEEVREALK